MKREIDAKWFYYLAILVHFVVELNADYVNSFLPWWGSIVFIFIAYAMTNRYLVLKPFPFIVWWGVFVTFVAMSALYAEDAGIVINYLVTMVVQLVIIYMLLLGVKNKRDIEMMLILFAVAIVYEGVYILINIDTKLFALERIGQASTGNWNSNSIGMMMTVQIILDLYFLKKTKRWAAKICLLSMIALSGYLVVVTASRKAIIMLVMALCIDRILSNPRKLVRNLLFICLAVSIILWAIFEIPYLYELIGWRIDGLTAILTGTGTVDSSTLLRQKYITFGYDSFLKSPIFGYGMDNFRVLLQRYMGKSTYSHNNFVELAVGLGLVGLSVYYSIFLYTADCYLKIRKKDALLNVLISAIIVYLIVHYAMVAVCDFTQNLLLALFLTYASQQKRTERISKNESDYV